jgi:hypothetical protein
MYDLIDTIAKLLAIAIVPLIWELRRQRKLLLRIVRYTRPVAQRFAPDEVTGPIAMQIPPQTPPRGVRMPRKPAPAFGVEHIKLPRSLSRSDDDSENDDD